MSVTFHFEIGDDSHERLENIRMRTRREKIVDVVRDALELYDLVAERVLDGEDLRLGEARVELEQFQKPKPGLKLV